MDLERASEERDSGRSKNEEKQSLVRALGKRDRKDQTLRETATQRNHDI